MDCPIDLDSTMHIMADPLYVVLSTKENHLIGQYPTNFLYIKNL